MNEPNHPSVEELCECASPIKPKRCVAGKTEIAISLLLIGLVAGTYFNALHNGFVILDDPIYATANAHVEGGLTWSGLRWATTATDASLWHPFTWFSLMLDTQLFGHGPMGYHVTNLIFHAANTALLFLVLIRLTNARWRSTFVAALFGIHPLHVESVAWISERKDVLSTFFFLLTLWAYTRYVEARGQLPVSSSKLVSSRQSVVSSSTSGASRPDPELRTTDYGLRTPEKQPRFYVLALGFFALGLMSKPMLVTVPFVLLLVDFWPLRRIGGSGKKSGAAPSQLRVFLEKLPFFALSFACGLVTLFAQRGAGSFMSTAALPLSDRLANTLLSSVGYLTQALWPAGFSMYYPYPKEFSTIDVALACLALLLLLGLALWNLRRGPYLAFGLGWYVVTLLPVAGLVQVGRQAHADRYTYIPLIGVFVAIAWSGEALLSFAISSCGRRWQSLARACCAVIGAACVLACIPVTRRQIGYWKDSEVLIRHTLQVTRDNPMALYLYGLVLRNGGQKDAAIKDLQEAVRLAPNFAEAQDNLAAALFDQGHLDEAIDHARLAVKYKPDLASAYGNLGAALGSKGKVDEAIQVLQVGVRLAPKNATTRFNLASALAIRGHYEAAVVQYKEVLRLDPTNQMAAQSLQLAQSRANRGKGITP